MIGTLVNAAAVIAGSLAGLLFNKKLPEKYVTPVFQAIGIFTLFLGLKMAFMTDHILLMVFSLVFGALTGTFLNIEKGMETLSLYLQRKTKSRHERFSEGLTTAFLLYCMGSMTILGAIEEGLGNPPNLLLTKSVMDGFSSVALASALGAGVLFSAIPLFLFQGGITLFAGFFEEYMTEMLINELSAVGGIMLIGLGFSILKIKKIQVLNLLPSLVYILILIYFFG